MLDIWKRIRRKFLRQIEKWEAFREKRSMIEVIFDIVKNTLGLKHLSQYMSKSVEKKVCRIFLSFPTYTSGWWHGKSLFFGAVVEGVKS